MGQTNSNNNKITPVYRSPKMNFPEVNLNMKKSPSQSKKKFITKYNIDMKLCTKLQPLQIYKKDGCPYCINTVQLCKLLNIKYVEKLKKKNEKFIKKTTSDYKFVPVIYCKNSELVCKK